MHSTSFGAEISLLYVIPFAGILLSIALCPLLIPRFWHRHYHKIALGWALALAVPFLINYKGNAAYHLLHVMMVDYIPFIILLTTLFTVTGGIVVHGNRTPTPLVNATILLIGTILASFIGTTGASILLIRPILRINQDRQAKTHIVIFFIFLVSNIGGCLTPLGDPPLFLGFLHGVPFFWTFGLYREMFTAAFFLLIIFFIIDSFYFKREYHEEIHVHEVTPFKVCGIRNVGLLAGVIGAILFSGYVNLSSFSILGVNVTLQDIIRDVILLVLCISSLVITPKKYHDENAVSFGPIKEVAYLFAGIFITIVPMILILQSGPDGHLGFVISRVKTPADYFWATGLFSSFLDNAPTYLTFFNMSLGRFYHGVPESVAVLRLISEHGVYLQAVAVGAVFMGANTYIGNAPNFMVKSIAERSGVRMPTFFGYVFKYSLPILIPVFILITFIFFN